MKKSDEILSDVSVALVEPRFPINVAYVARAMANFGLERLFIVERGSGCRRIFGGADEARKFASHGQSVVDKLTTLRSFEELREKFSVIVATTAIRGKRKSNITRRTLELKDCIRKIEQTCHSMGPFKSKDSETVCFVFGRDTTGLTNEEIRLCDYSLSIVTGTHYNTLNVSHAASIVFYALREYRRNAEMTQRRSPLRQLQPNNANRIEKTRTVQLFKELAEAVDFQKFKMALLSETIERLLNRSDPSLKEIHVLMSLASKANTKIRVLSCRGADKLSRLGEQYASFD